MIRWVTPVKEFMRTAREDTTIRGVPIAAGESVLLSYPSGNRDEDVFTDPFRFDVGRDPNKHVAFGYGVHFCLGAALARMEVNSFFSALLPRLRSIELTGQPEHTATTSSAGSSTCRSATNWPRRAHVSVGCRRNQVLARRATRCAVVEAPVKVQRTSIGLDVHARSVVGCALDGTPVRCSSDG